MKSINGTSQQQPLVKADTPEAPQLFRPWKVTKTPSFPNRNKKQKRKSNSWKPPIFQGRWKWKTSGCCGKRWTLRGLKPWRFGAHFFRTDRPYPTKRESRKIIDLKVLAGSWYVRSQVSKIRPKKGRETKKWQVGAGVPWILWFAF